MAHNKNIIVGILLAGLRPKALLKSPYIKRYVSMKKFLFLIIVKIFSPFAFSAEECASYKKDGFRTDTIAFESDVGIYPNLIVSKDISVDELKIIIGSFQDSIWTARAECESSDALFFNMLLAGKLAPGFNGYFILKDGHYFSGPHSLLKSNEVVIQTSN
jgi:hypothetical protein